MGRYWAKEDVDILKAHTIDKCVLLFPEKTRSALLQKRKKLGIKDRLKNRWQKWEDKILLDNEIIKCVILLPERTLVSIRQRRRHLGVANKIIRWACEDMQKLRQCHNLKESYAVFPYKKKNAIKSKRRALSLAKDREMSIWSEKELQIIKTCNPKQVKALLPHKNKFAIHYKRKRLGLTKTLPRVYKDRFFFDEINTEQKCYILGLIASDGCVSNNTLSIKLISSDKNILYKIKNIMGGSVYPSKPTKNKKYKSSPMHVWSCTSKRLADKIKSIGIVACKSLVLTGMIFKHIPNNLMCHFLRGCTDGDGCFSNLGSYSYGSGSKIFMKAFYKVLCKICDINYNPDKLSECVKTTLKGKKSYFFRISFGRFESRKIHDVMYDNSIIHLERKFKLKPKRVQRIQILWTEEEIRYLIKVKEIKLFRKKFPNRSLKAITKKKWELHKQKSYTF